MKFNDVFLITQIICVILTIIKLLGIGYNGYYTIILLFLFYESNTISPYNNPIVNHIQSSYIIFAAFSVILLDFSTYSYINII